MAENAGSDESEFGSVTSSQRSFLNKSPFADPHGGVEDTDSDTTEVIVNPVYSPVTRTPVLSLSTPVSLDSINDEDVFRTPPENASLSSAAESEPLATVSVIKPRGGGGGGSKSKSPSDVTPLTSPPPSFAAGDVEVPGGASKSKSPSPVSASEPLPAETVKMNRVSDPKESVTEVTPLSSPPSLARGNVRAPGKDSDFDSSTPSATEGIKVNESGDDYEIDIPFKEVIEALLRNNGENLNERVCYVDILKQFGIKFP
ncbi:hypothetical protein N665_3865s0002 [Sinapis alba]|nr:hypothetical protein N665_3865s0002 [Sinapis alba]